MTGELQKIVVLCVVVAALVVGGFFAFFYPGGSNKEANINSFEDCIAAGNPAMESYPRQCRTEDGKHFVEEIDDPVGTPAKEVFQCPAKQTGPSACIAVYQPVCGEVQIQCVTSPCPPVQETFSNSCVACSNSLVETYTEGECSQ